MKKERMEKIFSEVKKLMKKVNPEAEITFEEINKPNGVILHGIISTEPAKNYSPIVYLERFPDEAGEKEVAEAVVQILNEAKAPFPTGKVDLTDLSLNNIKDHLYLVLVDPEMNEKLLENTLHYPIEAGFVYVPYVYHVDETGESYYRFPISLKSLADTGCSKEELYSYALANTMKNLIPDLLEIPDTNGVHILTSKKDREAGSFDIGSSVLFFSGVIRNLEKKLGPCMAFPAHRNEWIIYPLMSGSMSIEEAKQLMTATLIASNPDAQEFLSKRIFRIAHGQITEFTHITEN